MSTSIDLATVVERLQAGDAQAMHELYEHYADALWRYIQIRLSDAEAAHDCLQDVFFKVWKSMPTFEFRSDPHFTAWLYTIAHHLVVSHIRKRKRQPQVPLTPELNVIDVRRSDTARTVGDRLAVQQALEELTREQQQVIRLKFFAGLSNTEIATTMQRTEGAIKALQHRALNRLQRLLSVDPSAPVLPPAIQVYYGL